MFPHVTWLHLYQASCPGHRLTPSSQPFAAFVLQSAAAAFTASRQLQCRFAKATHSGRGAFEPLEPLELLAPPDELELFEEEPEPDSSGEPELEPFGPPLSFGDDSWPGDEPSDGRLPL